MISPLGVAIAALGGAAVGFERQWSGHATGPDARFGGFRTFTLLGGLGGIAGGCVTAGWSGIALALFAALMALIAMGYAAKSREDVDATTEVAAVVVVAAGALAGAGELQLASGIIAVTAALLVEKSRLHALVHRIDDDTLRASVRFAVLALVILPVLPAGAYGPFDAVRPREVWAFVLFFSGLSFAGWIARRLLGATHGTVVAGLLGGLVSSTSITLSFARASRTHVDRFALALGTVSACVVMLVRVAVAAAILNPPVGLAFARYVWPSFVVGVVLLGGAFMNRKGQREQQPAEAGSPLQLGAALQMAAAFQIVIIGIAAVMAWWSLQALLPTSALIGLTDLDALTLSIARSPTPIESDLAGKALAVGVLSNSLLKLVVAAVVGKGAYRLHVAFALGLMAAAVAGAVWLF